MKLPIKQSPRCVAISLELDWGYKRHLEVYAGCQKYADEAGWQCSINPAPERMLKKGAGLNPYDGVIARANAKVALAAQQAGVPLVNVWVNSPARGLPSVFADFEASGVMAAKHLLARGFRRFAYLGFLNDLDSRWQLGGFRQTVRDAGFACSSHRVARNSISGHLPWRPHAAPLSESSVSRWGKALPQKSPA